MKIDLHCHTKKVKTGDAVTRNVSIEKFCEKVIKADVKILAITEHLVYIFANLRFVLAVRYLLKKVIVSLCNVLKSWQLQITIHSIMTNMWN